MLACRPGSFLGTQQVDNMPRQSLPPKRGNVTGANVSFHDEKISKLRSKLVSVRTTAEKGYPIYIAEFKTEAIVVNNAAKIDMISNARKRKTKQLRVVI